MKVGGYLVAKENAYRQMCIKTYDMYTDIEISHVNTDSFVFKKNEKYLITNLTDKFVEIIYKDNEKVTFSLYENIKHYEYYGNIFYDVHNSRKEKLKKLKEVSDSYECSIYYCEDCNKIYNSCYELEGISMCPRCWSEKIEIIDENKILAFIRKKRLKKLKEISENEKL